MKQIVHCWKDKARDCQLVPNVHKELFRSVWENVAYATMDLFDVGKETVSHKLVISCHFEEALNAK